MKTDQELLDTAIKNFNDDAGVNFYRIKGVLESMPSKVLNSFDDEDLMYLSGHMMAQLEAEQQAKQKERQALSPFLKNALHAIDGGEVYEQ